MSDESSVSDAKSRASELAEELETKGIYVALALLFIADAAGVFAASVPVVIFVSLFLVALGIDAYT